MRQHGPPKPHAHFFCSFKDQRRGSGTAFIKTLAFQLAHSVPGLQQRLLDSLLKDGNESKLDDVRLTACGAWLPDGVFGDLLLGLHAILNGFWVGFGSVLG